MIKLNYYLHFFPDQIATTSQTTSVTTIETTQDLSKGNHPEELSKNFTNFIFSSNIIFANNNRSVNKYKMCVLFF